RATGRRVGDALPTPSSCAGPAPGSDTRARSSLIQIEFSSDYEIYCQLPHGSSRSVCLDSTAAPQSVAAVRLWLHRPTHRVVLTARLCWPSPAGPTAFAAR